MIEVKPVEESVSRKTSTLAITWKGLREVGGPADVAGSLSRSVQFAGDFDTATVILEGSNDGETWVVLQDHIGMAVICKGRDLRSVATMTRFVRPRVEGAGANTKIDCTFLHRSSL